MNAPLPGPLNDNPVLERWVRFASDGKVEISKVWREDDQAADGGQ